MSSPRRRGFQETRDNLLTAITGGVAAEPHPFPPPIASKAPFRYSLGKPPALEITSVYGTRNQQSHLFRAGVDYRLLDDRQTLEWPKGGETPDPGSVFHVNYRPKAAGAVVTDIYTGSVVRTLAESIALEIARLYAQLDLVYKSAFIDSAEGRSLENLVRLLDLERIPGGRAAGEVVFERADGSKGAINIPAGTRVMTEDGTIEYETTAAVTLSDSQNSVRVQARDVEPNDPVAAGALSVMPGPIAGIADVTNPAPTAITTREESDEELRERAKTFLHGSERGTLGALVQALRREGLRADVVEVFDDAAGGPDRVEVTLHAEALDPELEQRVLAAIERARPAGVLVELKGALSPRSVDLGLRLTSKSGLLEADLRSLQRTLREELADYFARLPAEDPASINRIVGLVLAHPELEDVAITGAMLNDLDAGGNPVARDVIDRAGGKLAIGKGIEHPQGLPKKLGELVMTDPALPTRLDVIVGVPPGTARPDANALRAALSALLATFNDGNAVDGAAPGTLSFEQLVAVLPLPGVGAGSSDPAPYTARFAFTAETSESRILARTGDAYAAEAFERISVFGVDSEESV